MRWKSYLWYTEKEDPSETEAISHKYLFKGGFIKQVSSGIYEFLPPSLKVLRKIENIIRKHMNKINAQELLLTVLNPKELWEETKRWEKYGEELFKLKDRNEREYCLGPTHEEEITDLVRKVVKSYKSLPITLYQIQVKFRDEKRPRFGLIRSREFLMKDAYSFHTDYDDVLKTYEDIKKAYSDIFEELSLKVYVAKADVGQIGGSSSHEFIAITPYGEALLAYCENCNFASNAEIVSLDKIEVEKEPFLEKKEVYTPNIKSIEELSSFLKVSPSKIIKAVFYLVEGKPVIIFIRGDKKVDEKKLEKLFNTENFQVVPEDDLKEFGTFPGFIGPFNLRDDIKTYWDNSLKDCYNMVCAFNEKDKHYINVNFGRDIPYPQSFVDVRQVEEKDSCPNCGHPLSVKKGLELGHTFVLGTRYSDSMKAYFTDKDGSLKPIVMGCYGIGVSRIIPALIEQHHDDKGIIWPIKVSPFELLIIVVNVSDEKQLYIGNYLYEQATQENIDVIIDDRDLSPGTKFNDADLVGIPIRVIVGKKVRDNKVEISLRDGSFKEDVDIDKALYKIKELIYNK